MKSIYQKLKDLKIRSSGKSFTKLVSSIIVLSAILISCKKEETTSETWQFTKLVNATLDNDGYMVTLDFYQKKGDEWRIVQMTPDDYANFYLKKIITPNSFQLPIDNPSSYITSNVQLFNPADEKVYNQGNLRWYLGDPIQFNSFNTFNYEFPEMPIAYTAIGKFSAATFSLEQAYDNNPKTRTYLFYDFPNQKYVYYGFRVGADLILENTLPQICPTCNTINWNTIDAVTNTGIKGNTDLYYFFDFDARKMYILNRINKYANNASFQLNNLPINFDDAFYNEAGSNGGEELPFDFSK
ncbi:MAG: hypothetical protein K1X55_15405 [Chitinophagales bacterium]|nr:hypothetical protein [Chitinophagales bacterium]